MVRHIKNKRYVKVFLVLLIILLIVIGIVFFYRRTTKDIFVDKSGAENRNISSLVADERPINILILGTDTGDFGRHYKGRTDEIMMMSISPANNNSILVSIPRDSNAIFPNYPEYGVTKINSAYTLGGVNETILTLNKYYNVPIDGYALINFKGLINSVNDLGGINVRSPLTFDNMNYSFEAGKTYHMNGKQAFAFVNMRHQDPNNDYGRQERQQLVLQAMIKKALRISNLLKPRTINKFLHNIQTDVPLRVLISLAKNYGSAANNSTSDHAQGVSKETINPKYGLMEIEVVSKKERQRISDKIRKQLGLPNEKVKALKSSYVMRRK